MIIAFSRSNLKATFGSIFWPLSHRGLGICSVLEMIVAPVYNQRLVLEVKTTLIFSNLRKKSLCLISDVVSGYRLFHLR